eukprot:Sspe_Gene.77132::Locus_48173_Transcript_1_1_Confidence_1.000_Length_679::g.77132::m.77132
MAARCVIPAKLLVIFAGFLSAFASLAGGLLMYFEGLALLEQTVREGAKSDLDATSTILKQTMQLPKMVADKHRLLLMNLHKAEGRWETPYQLSQYLMPIATFDVYTTGIYGVGVQSTSAVDPVGNSTGVSDYVWYDVLEDGSREYIHAHYNTTLYNRSADCPEFCTLCYAIDTRTAEPTHFAYSYSDAGPEAVAVGGAWYESLRGWE